MKCGNCGNHTEDGWEFCPKCGARLRGEEIFSDVFERVEKEMDQFSKMFDKDFEVFDLSPFFRKTPRGNGFSIKITQSNKNKPKVSVKTFGNVDRKEIEHEVERMGLNPGKEKGGGQAPVRKEFDMGTRVTEEPETDVKRMGDKITVEMKLPGVRDAKDIRINSLENSIEVKAIAGNKAYFKILTKPSDFSIIGKEFGKGVLHLEFG
ncbi:MAG: zinc ribbon domain-containing protein [Candidatus Aenigmarchaeota archaeon]|nr:zinc ribbon domain-containing protein [Candidatus Aenigmarchaeota archaeon]